MGEPGDKGPVTWGWARTVGVIGVAIVAAAGIYAVIDRLSGRNGSIEIVVDRATGVTIKAQPGEAIATLIDAAFMESAAAVGGVLAERGFYKLHSDNMITALALTDPATLEPSTLTRYRKLLGEFEGPFERPGALLESDGELLSAIADLETEVRASRTTNQLIAEIWQASLDQQGIFRPRLLKARIVVIPGAGDRGPDAWPVFFTCPGNPIRNRLITIGAPSDGDGRPLPAQPEKLDGVVRDDPFMSGQLGCAEGASQTLAAFVLGEPMVLGLDFDSLQQMVAVAQGSDEEIFAWVQVKGRIPS